MKMAARMSCLPSQIPQRWEYLFFKEGWSLQEWWRLVRKCPAGVSERPSKAINVHGLKILKTYKLCWWTLWTSLPTSTSLVFARLSSVFTNKLVVVSLAPCHSLNQGCKRFLKRFTHVVNKIKRFLIPSPLASTCIFFLVHVDYSSKSRSCVQSFDSFKPNEIELNVTNWEIARLCGSFSKKKYYRIGNFVKNCWEN